MKTGWVIIILIFISAIRCGSDKGQQASTVDTNELIDQEIFTQLMAEVQLIESHGMVLRPTQPYIKDSLMHYYAEVFDRYGVSPKQFYTTLEYYTGQPNVLLSIYENALVILQEKETLLQDVDISVPPITATSRQQLGELILTTPIAELMCADSTYSIPYVRDSLFSYLSHNDSLLKPFGVNLPSVQFTFAVNSSSPPVYEQLCQYVLARMEKKAGID